MRKSSWHSKTLLHRNQAQARQWFARLLFKNNKKNNKHFNNQPSFRSRGVLQKQLFLKFHKIYSKKPFPVSCKFIEKEILRFQKIRAYVWYSQKRTRKSSKSTQLWVFTLHFSKFRLFRMIRCPKRHGVLELSVEKKVFLFAKRALLVGTAHNKWLK